MKVMVIQASIKQCSLEVSVTKPSWKEICLLVSEYKPEAISYLSLLKKKNKNK